MHKTVACIVVRMNSMRFPGKALAHLYDGTPMLLHLMRRLQSVSNINDVCVCTTQHPEDDTLERFAKEHGAHVYRGSENDVVARMLGAADELEADTIVRVTGDNPLTACDLLPTHIDLHHREALDFSRFVRLPLGMTADVLSATALRKCSQVMGHTNSEYFLFTMFDPSLFRCGVLTLERTADFSSTSVSVDTPHDLEQVRRILLSHTSPLHMRTDEVISFIRQFEDNRYAFGSNVPVRVSPERTVSYAEFLEDMDTRIQAANAYEIEHATQASLASA